MAVIRQLNLLGQMRLDVPHLRSLESSIAADFDLLAGNIMAGQKALIVRGFDIDTSGEGQPATTLNLNVAGSILLHPLASEAGTIFAVDADAQPEVLSPANGSVSGSFIPSQDNFIGIDLRREADPSTIDTVMFLDANTRLETPRSIPLARTLSYKIVISTTDFTATPHVCPVAKVELDSVGQVRSIIDCRPMAYRLGAGGSLPDALHTYPWIQGRTPDSANEFGRGDKSIGSEKDWRDAVMTRLWELGGGERWYSPASDRDFKLTFGQPVFANGKNFDWDKDTGILKWKSIAVVFANSTASLNTVKDNTVGKSMPDGHCLYVDIKRSAVAEVVADVANMPSLGTPSVPGSRVIIAWRNGDHIFVRDYPFELNRDLTGIPPSTGEHAYALFQGETAGTYEWRQVNPFVAGNVGQVQFDAGEGLGGSDNLFWDNDNKRLGIGTAQPLVPFHLKHTINEVARLVGSPNDTFVRIGDYTGTDDTSDVISTVIGTGGTSGFVGTSSKNDFIVKTSNQTRLTVTKDGDVGVGTPSAPSTSLHVYRYQPNPDWGTPVINAESNENPKILVSESGEGRPVAQLGTFGGHGFVGTLSNHPFGIGTNDVDRVTIGTDGKVGIGAGLPEVPLHISYSTNEIARFVGTTDDTFARFGNYVADGQSSPINTVIGTGTGVGFVGTSSSSDFIIKTNNSERIRIKDTSGVIELKYGNVEYWRDFLNGSINETLKWKTYIRKESGWNYSDFMFQELDGSAWTNRGWVSGTKTAAAMNDFTGQHRCLPDGIDISDAKDMVGLICVSAGIYAKDGEPVDAKDGVTINESLPMVRLSSKPKEKCVFGVISDAEDPESSVRAYASGVFVSAYPKAEKDNRLIINALGEGAVWVCDANGPLENGDYITTSEVPGHGMKQDDDLLHNYTVAKITMDCDFNPQSGEYEVVEFEHNGKKYKKAFVGCTYHCG